MEHTQAHSLNTKLHNRTLWYDGESSFDPTHLQDLVQRYPIKYVDYVTDEVKSYNKHVKKTEELQIKNACGVFNNDWQLPDEYLQLDVIDYVLSKHDAIIRGLSDSEIYKRDRRLSRELVMYRDKGLLGVLRTIIYIINRLTTTGVVWGIGRGSSVSSYVLYVIGAHDVDSYAYDLDINDFLHE